MMKSKWISRLLFFLLKTYFLCFQLILSQIVMYKTRHCKENYQWMFTVGQWENAWSLWADIKALREKEREREEREREREIETIMTIG
jgi:hypothetical protein